jgi:peptidoglycan/LPS O-acetylase OafA/YrhL
MSFSLTLPIYFTPHWLTDQCRISYSLYLFHVPIGGRIINLGTRLGESVAIKIIILLIALLLSIGAAFLMYNYIENPTHKLSKKFSIPNIFLCHKF